MKPENKKLIAISFFLAITMIASAFLISSSGFRPEEALNAGNYKSTIQEITSIQFILFVLFLPLTYAIISIACKVIEKKQAYIAAIDAFIISAIISYFAFGMDDYLIIGIFYGISLIVAIETASLGFIEFKSMIYPRAVSGGAKKGMLIVGIGIFIFSAMTVAQDQPKYVKAFEDTLLSAISGTKGVDYTDMAAQVVASSQEQTLDMVMSTQQYANLLMKEDQDVQNYVALMNQLKMTTGSKEYQETLKKQIAAKQGELFGGNDVDLFTLAKQKMPIFKVVEDNFWLIESMSITLMFFTFGNLIIGTIAAIYGFFFGILLKALKAEN